MASYQIQQLSEFCRLHRQNRKVVFVPSIQAGSSLGTALARSGTDWVNLQFVTPEDFARSICEPDLLVEGWSPLPKEADLLEMAPVLKTFLDSPANVYFRNQSFSRGLLRSVFRTVRALRIAGTPPETLLKQRGNHKLQAIAQLYVAYQDILESHQWYDGPDLFLAAMGKLETSPLRQAEYAILDETPLPGLARKFLNTLTDGKMVRIGRKDYGTTVPGTLAAGGLKALNLAAEAECAPAGRILSDTPEADELSEIQLRTGSGPESEIRAALTAIQENGWPLDTVEWVCASDDYFNYAYDAVHRLGLPATFGAGVSILLTRPGQALRAALNWVATGGDPKWLLSLQSGRLLNVDPGKPGELPDVLVEIRALIDESGPVKASRLAILGAKMLAEHVSTLEEREEPARDSLVSRFEHLAESTNAEGSASEMAGVLLDVVEAHRYAPGAPRQGHLNVVPMERSGFANRDHVFILGLDNGSFPGAPGEDPLLLDHERTALSEDLEMLRTRPVSRVWHLVRLLGLNREITLSASTFRLSDGQENEPAALFLHLQAATGCSQPPADRILPSTQEKPPDVGIWTLSWAHAGGHPDALADTTPWLFDGLVAETDRRQMNFTRYKGLIPSVESADRDDEVWSASRLETLSRCPYRYFWRYVLQIEPPEEDRDLTRWLTPLEFGSLLHKLFQHFMSHAPDRDVPPDIEKGTQQIFKILDELVDETARMLPPPTLLAYQVDLERLRTAARVFIAEESQRPLDHKPRGFEVSFGFDDEGGLNQPDPVSLELGDQTVLLRGLIDRVDETDQGYIIWDYKTGSAIPYDASDLLGTGEHLQWALYAHAFSEILRKRDKAGSIRSGYYFASDREHGRKMLAAPPILAELSAMLRPVLRMANKTAYLPVQKTPQCRFCDYKVICQSDAMLPKSIAAGPDEKHPELLELVMEWLPS